jgi:DNA-directed RNA polymerase subunit RPC12/RpoP
MRMVVRSYLCVPCGYAETVTQPQDARPISCPKCGGPIPQFQDQKPLVQSLLKGASAQNPVS